MLKKLDHLLNIIIGSTVGVLIGYCIFTLYDYHTYPNLYALRSAPWYTGILLYGAATIVIIAAACIIKLFIHKKLKQ